jgi:hypothetical protein
VNGYIKQLRIYNEAEKSFASRYVIINVGGMGKKLKQVETARQCQLKIHRDAPKVIVVNGLPRESASKAKGTMI